VPDHPILPFIEGDGTGAIFGRLRKESSMRRWKSYGGQRAIRWFEIFAGEKAFRQFGNWLRTIRWPPRAT